MNRLNKLEKRILQISYDKKLSHISSCLTSVSLIDNIYKIKKPNDIFILSSGHAGLALYCVLEKYEGKNAEKLFDKHGVHPNRNLEDGIYCSSGSLGSAIMVAMGMALANRKRDVYVLISDGECAEGSVWEILNIAREQKLDNLKVTVNANGTGAYGEIDIDLLEKRLQSFFPLKVIRTDMFQFPSYLQGFDGHYKVLSEQEYKEVIHAS